MFSSEIHYLGETLRKYNYINHEHSSYIVYGSPLDYRYLFDWLTIFYYEISNQNIILTSNLGRITCSFLFCYAFFHFSKTLEIDLVSTLIIICVFLLMNQQIIGGNKLFANGFQSTTISNALNILSFSFFKK